MSSHGRTFIYAPGVHINYRVHGHGPQTIILLHGFAAALTTWDDLMPLFPVDRFTLHALDLKGFGFSSKPRDGRYRLQDQADIVAAFIERHNLEQVVLAGHSLGGGIALLTLLGTIAEGKGGLISRCVLMDCAAYPQRFPRLFHILLLPVVNRLLMRIVPVRAIVRYNLAHVYADPRTMTPARIERYVSCFSRRGLDSVFIDTIRSLKGEPFTESIAQYGAITVPTLIIWGSSDRIVRPHYGERLAAEIPGSRLVIIPDCGHNPHEERPDETFAAIAAFLSGR